ncbi:unnamed protein product [Tuber melanosporum]|uniref:(Perigord truffle) hypothetical protein n=1 Tax=Tuber melanosporum (strain Mel28) TaxID=656061 RepID=D5GFP1_TUBMM|nr:uncharacterized protein GSTUM_00001846001 [Tuber melanosporum]CAZ83334.1 unnamed protein product [Tuber melanosporum]
MFNCSCTTWWGTYYFPSVTFFLHFPHHNFHCFDKQLIIYRDTKAHTHLPSCARDQALAHICIVTPGSSLQFHKRPLTPLLSLWPIENSSSPGINFEP